MKLPKFLRRGPTPDERDARERIEDSIKRGDPANEDFTEYEIYKGIAGYTEEEIRGVYRRMVLKASENPRLTPDHRKEILQKAARI